MTHELNIDFLFFFKLVFGIIHYENLISLSRIYNLTSLSSLYNRSRNFGIKIEFDR